MIIPATPDFGHSDFWHFNFAVKFFLGQALHNGYLPFWSKDIGTGFPLFAESQVGIFNIFNLIFFRLFDPALAINLGYLTTFLVVISGTYLFCRSINFERKISLFASFLFGFCGIFITHVPHFNFIQTAAFLPWVFFATQKIISTKKIRFGLLLSFIVSQQFYSGYPQMVMISLIGSTLYLLWHFWLTKSIKPLVIYTAFVSLGIILATPQILATWTLLRLSPPLSQTTYGAFPYSPVNLLSFLNPYLFGDPRIGTYPPPSENWGIFWESTGYFGLFPFLLACVAIFKSKKTQVEIALLIILGIALTLMLGKYTPAGFINNFAPFSFFRLPARYLLLTSWALILLSCSFLNHLGVNKSKVRQRLINFFILISLADLAYFSFTYNAFIPANKWLEKPETVSFLNKTDPSWYRVHAIAPTESWNSYFMTGGWSDMSPFFPFRNSLDANQNLYWKISSADLYTRLDLRRRLLYKILVDGETRNFSDGTFELTPEGLKLLSLSGVKYVTSPGPIKNSSTLGLKELFRTRGEAPFWLYQAPSPFPHAYTTRDYVVVKNLSSYTGRLLKNPGAKTVVLESEIDLTPDHDPITPATVIINSDLEVVIETNVERQSILVLSDSVYPNWVASIDNIRTKILPTNINERSVIVPAGKHKIIFKFDPLTFN